MTEWQCRLWPGRPEETHRMLGSAGPDWALLRLEPRLAGFHRSYNNLGYQPCVAWTLWLRGARPLAQGHTQRAHTPSWKRVEKMRLSFLELWVGLSQPRPLFPAPFSVCPEPLTPRAFSCSERCSSSELHGPRETVEPRGSQNYVPAGTVLRRRNLRGGVEARPLR